MESIAILVLAAGLGTRMNSKRAKVLHEAAGKPLIQHVLSTADSLSPERVVVITGHQSDEVRACVNAGAETGLFSKDPIRFALQEEQKGTGHAVQCALSELKGFTGTVVILSGDVPLVRKETISTLIEEHEANKATVSVLSFFTPRPRSYGRIIRSEDGTQVKKIVEAKDATPSELLIQEVNSGVYAVDSSFLEPAINALEPENAQKELYLTDIIEKAASEGQTVAVHMTFDEAEVFGVNTPAQLHAVEREIRERSVESFVLNRVRFLAPETVYIGDRVSIGAGTVIGPNVVLKGNTEIAEDVVIDGSAFLENVSISRGAHIKFSVRAEDVVIGENTSVGPFANLRPGTVTESDVRIGNFVEIKKSMLHEGSKVPHLSYVGDAEVGKKANVGAGTITCNYDGVNKSKTTIGENAFIGSNSSLVAPVEIGKGATIGAGSTISKDVEGGALAFTRAPMKVKQGWKRPSKK